MGNELDLSIRSLDSMEPLAKRVTILSAVKEADLNSQSEALSRLPSNGVAVLEAGEEDIYFLNLEI